MPEGDDHHIALLEMDAKNAYLGANGNHLPNGASLQTLDDRRSGDRFRGPEGATGRSSTGAAFEEGDTQAERQPRSDTAN